MLQFSRFAQEGTHPLPHPPPTATIVNDGSPPPPPQISNPRLNPDRLYIFFYPQNTQHTTVTTRRLSSINAHLQ